MSDNFKDNVGGYWNVNPNDSFMANADCANNFINLYLDAPMTIFPSLESRHKRNAAKRQKREKIEIIHHLTTSTAVISSALMSEGKLVPRYRKQTHSVPVVEEEEAEDEDEDEDEEEDDDDEDATSEGMDNEGDLPRILSHPPLPLSREILPLSQTRHPSENLPVKKQSAAPPFKRAVRDPSLPPRPVGRPRSTQPKPPPAEKRPRGRPRKSAEAFGVTPYSAATVLAGAAGSYANGMKMQTSNYSEASPQGVSLPATASTVALIDATINTEISTANPTSGFSHDNQKVDSTSCMSSTFLF